MGAGKTTVGRALAAHLGWAFVDLDGWIEERTGRTVPQLFRARGEAAFRREEEAAARELAGRTEVVVAAGGGAFAFPATREALQARALSVWLRCDLDAVLRRVPLDGSRPLAANRETIQRLFEEREPSYRLADVTVEASTASVEDLARTIAETLRLPSGGARP